MTNPYDFDPDHDRLISRAFEARHPALAAAGRLIKRRPIAGTITAALLLAGSIIVVETVSGANTLFQRWAQTNVYARAEAQMREEAVANGEKHASDDAIHLGALQTLPGQLTFFGVDGGTAPPAALPSKHALPEPGDTPHGPEIFDRPPQILHAGQQVAAMYDLKGKIAAYEKFVIVWDGDEWGYVPHDQYIAAHLSERDTPQ